MEQERLLSTSKVSRLSVNHNSRISSPHSERFGRLILIRPNEPTLGVAAVEMATIEEADRAMHHYYNVR